ncbi:alkaline phosphatase family protein [Streptomyces sp. HUAS TT7]|uniref:alkaline phosphatase family protein n=1 Tax=Streptomyces sp. HUAS TT7 TaxID=3447507 RepID=UPI003F655B7F
MAMSKHARSPRAKVVSLSIACGLSLVGAGLLASNGFAAEPASPAVNPAAAAPTSGLPTPDHVVVVMFENHRASQVIGTSSAPYYNQLANRGALLTASHAITHPSQPNYFALFSGSTQKLTSDTCPDANSLSGPNLASEVIAKGRTWGSYNESMPKDGPTKCHPSGSTFWRKHNPWFSFKNVPAATAHTFADFPQSDFSKLPTVSFVTPNINSDMHNTTVQYGDTWLKKNMAAYANWAQAHNSLLVLDFDEDDHKAHDPIATVFYGQPVKAGSKSSTTYDHYDLLRTIEDMYGTTHAGNAASGKDITGIWAADSGSGCTGK